MASRVVERDGERLRRLRTRAHKTLKEVSQAGALHLVHLGARARGSGASIASLRRLAEAYGACASFWADLDQSSPLVRSEDRPVMQWDNGVRFEEMASGEKVMDPSYIRAPAARGAEAYSHNGEEFVYVISGVLFVELKDQGTYRVAPGDTLYFLDHPAPMVGRRRARRGGLRQHPADLLRWFQASGFRVSSPDRSCRRARSPRFPVDREKTVGLSGEPR